VKLIIFHQLVNMQRLVIVGGTVYVVILNANLD